MESARRQARLEQIAVESELLSRRLPAEQNDNNDDDDSSDSDESEAHEALYIIPDSQAQSDGEEPSPAAVAAWASVSGSVSAQPVNASRFRTRPGVGSQPPPQRGVSSTSSVAAAAATLSSTNTTKAMAIDAAAKAIPPGHLRAHIAKRARRKREEAVNELETRTRLALLKALAAEDRFNGLDDTISLVPSDYGITHTSRFGETRRVAIMEYLRREGFQPNFVDIPVRSQSQSRAVLAGPEKIVCSVTEFLNDAAALERRLSGEKSNKRAKSSGGGTSESAAAATTTTTTTQDNNESIAAAAASSSSSSSSSSSTEDGAPSSGGENRPDDMEEVPKHGIYGRCTICDTNEAIVALECGHLFACHTCIERSRAPCSACFNLNNERDGATAYCVRCFYKCPHCRRECKTKMRIYIP
jgi:hypothetical protein